ncbi:MAG: hypothetical protein IPG06_22225 [Haliea sp.]|nr:hypothetical protein [Haliea sp.]
MLDHPPCQATLREELQLLMVDEFRDTSPIQLALFLKLAVGWAGDLDGHIKQVDLRLSRLRPHADGGCGATRDRGRQRARDTGKVLALHTGAGGVHQQPVRARLRRHAGARAGCAYARAQSVCRGARRRNVAPGRAQ